MSKIGSRVVLGIWSKLLLLIELAEIVTRHGTFKNGRRNKQLCILRDKVIFAIIHIFLNINLFILIGC